MHIPDAVLSPTVAATTAVIAAGGFGYGLSKIKDRVGERTTVLMGMMSAFLFAAQMVNFPVFPGVSGHLLGGVLAAVVVGPWAGAGVVAAVLIVQCFLFADGGLTALGANFVNMGLIGSVVGYAIYAPIRRAVGGPAGVLIGGMAAAWFSVILSAGAFAVELAASSGWGSFLRVLGWMTLVHAAIGVGEALITGLVLQSILLTRPDLIEDPVVVGPGRAGRWWQVALSGLAVALAVAAFLAPFASASPDGLEYVGGELKFLGDEAPPVVRAPLPDYAIPGLPDLKVVTAAVGILGTLVVFAVGLVLARTLARRAGAASSPSPAGVGPDAT